MGSADQSGINTVRMARLKHAHGWKALVVGLFVFGAVLLLPLVYEPFRIPDYLDNILFQTSYSGTAEETIELLNENSVYSSNPSDPTSREIVTGLRFSRSGNVLVIEHSRLSASVVSKIQKNIENDKEFLWWKLSPETLKRKETDRGSNSPSWQDAVIDLMRLGFATMRFTNGNESWDISLHLASEPRRQ